MINWHGIDTVFLDMDGTLLDLHFDNYFWLTHLPLRYAQHHGLCADTATRDLHQLFNEKRGSLEWYCLDYWQKSLAVDIGKLKEEVQHLIAERPHALTFLKALGSADKQRVLITNAHRKSLNLKLGITGIGSELDTIISSHDFGYPKEDQRFWSALKQTLTFSADRALFIDDSISVLKAAETYGIKYLYAIYQPDSKGHPVDTGHFPAIEHFDELFPGITQSLRSHG